MDALVIALGFCLSLGLVGGSMLHIIAAVSETRTPKPPKLPTKFSVWWHRRGWWMMAAVFFAAYTAWAMTLPR